MIPDRWPEALLIVMLAVPWPPFAFGWSKRKHEPNPASVLRKPGPGMVRNCEIQEHLVPGPSIWTVKHVELYRNATGKESVVKASYDSKTYRTGKRAFNACQNWIRENKALGFLHVKAKRD